MSGDVLFFSVIGDEPMGSTFTPPQTFCVHLYEQDAKGCAERLRSHGVSNVGVVEHKARRGPCQEPKP